MAHQARKRFGQHFLTDISIVNAIVSRIQAQGFDRVIEIGPGLGAMTLPLLQNDIDLDVVEIDRDLVDYWRKQSIPKLTIHQADALEFDFLGWSKLALETITKNNSNGRVKIIGNLPYNISTPLLFHLTHAIEYVDQQVFMLQKEVIDRMVAKPGDSDYGRLSVMLQILYDIDFCFEVPPSSFDPPPRVNSAVVSMLPKRNVKISNKEWASLEKIVAKAFAHRRKVLGNNISQYKEILELDEQTLRLRAQDIDGQTYLLWAKKLANLSHE